VTQAHLIQLGMAIVFILVAALLAATESALSTITRARADRLLKGGGPSAKRLRLIAEDPAPYINTGMLVRIVTEITAIVLVCLVVFDTIGPTWQRLLLAAGSMILVSFMGWGVAARTLGRQRAERVALLAATPISALTTVLGPLQQLLILLSNAVTPGRGYADGPFSTEAELREPVDQAEASDVIEEGERRMIHSVFELGDTLVKEVMVPRTDLVFIESTKNLRQALSLALRSGFSRIPVVGDGIDDIVGLLYLKDVIRRVYDHPDSEHSETVASMMRHTQFCPDSKPVDDLLRDMQLLRHHMVVVIDEFGGTAGLATIEDILEEIVGEIVDEYDAEPTLTQQVEPGVFRVSARLQVDEMGDLFELDVDDEDVETVGGLMAKELNLVPIPGSAIEWKGIRIQAEKAVGRRHQIDTCLVSLVEPDENHSEDTDGEDDDD